MQKIISCLRNDFGEEQLKAVAKIIIFGKKNPANCLLCSHAVYYVWIIWINKNLNALMQYVPKHGAETL